MEKETGKLSTVESVAILIFSLLILAIGGSSIGASYLVYSTSHSIGQFLWLQATVLMVGLGLGGVLVAIVNFLISLKR